MTFEQFDNFQAELLAEVVEMKNTKGKEYANSESRFANFDRLSKELVLTNTQIAWVYVTKHLDAIKSRIRTQETYSTEPIRGRIVDAITYLTLIAGMIQEGEQGKNNVINSQQAIGLTGAGAYFEDNMKQQDLYGCRHCGFTTPHKQYIIDHYAHIHQALWVP